MKTSIIYRLYFKAHSRAANFSLWGTCVTRRAAERIVQQECACYHCSSERFKIEEVPAIRAGNALLAMDDLQLLPA